VDYGAQYAQLIARRIREARVYSEVVPHDLPVDEILARDPAAIVLSGGPSSVYAAGAPGLDPKLVEAGVPTFGICYGFQAMAQALGGTVERTGLAEFGGTQLKVTAADSTLFHGCPSSSRCGCPTGTPSRTRPRDSGSSPRPTARPSPRSRTSAGVWPACSSTPRCMHSQHGQAVLEHFLYEVAGCEPTWTMANIIDEQVAAIQAQVGDKRAICGLSGGVDSAVAAALVQRAIGDRLTCVFVDHGLLRQGEAEQVERDFVAATGVQLKVVEDGRPVPRRARRGDRPGGEAQDHRTRVHPRVRAGRPRGGRRCRRTRRVGRVPRPGHALPGRRRVRRGAGAANIKSHHNVGGLPDDLPSTGRAVAHPVQGRGPSCRARARAARRRSSGRQPFPGPGLGIRIIGEVTRERLEILRAADAIAREELTAAGLDDEIWQCPVVLLADVGRSGSRETSAPTAIRWSCGRCPARTR
jgi:GMP synthase (glutamine-hydrolysing)